MATHDSIGDFLTIVRNASKAGKDVCTAQWSKIREGIASILKDEGYIASFEVSGEKAQKIITINMKYMNGVSALTGITRVSTPGCRAYYEYRNIPRVLNGMGISILTTSKGVLKDSDCRAKKVGGEILCKVW
ncbi:MAG: 30S ribosomal protein S8 [Candidatus Merdousia sp.]|nr:30S ribosomal protein S8 [Candidatus Merdousia sp.]